MRNAELHPTAICGLLRHARSFYELLGNRRKFERAPLTGTVFLSSKGLVMDTTHVASCVNVSLHGMAVDSPESLPADAFVEVHSDNYGPRRRARVRHCTQRGQVYRIGLEFVGNYE